MIPHGLPSGPPDEVEEPMDIEERLMYADADKERLDWMERELASGRGMVIISRRDVGLVRFRLMSHLSWSPTLRDAIDRARGVSITE